MARERLVIEVSEKGAKVVRGKIAGVGSAAQKSAGSVNLLTKALGGIGAALVLRSTIGQLRTFSQEMSTVKAITGATEAQFGDLSDRARELGARTRFSATEAAEGMVNLSRAGFDAAEAIGTIDDVLNLAQVGAIGLGDAASIAAAGLRGFRLETDQAGRVVDVLALAANSANTTVLELGDAMKFVAPVAASAGVEIEEATAIINALSDAGLKGSLAGTGLRQIIKGLVSPSREASKTLQELGVSMAEIDPTQVGLTGAIQRLADAGIDLEASFSLFQARGGPAFEILAASVPDIERMTEKLVGAEGTAERVARVMDDNLNGALLAVRSASEAVVLGFGQIGAESGLTVFFRRLAELLRLAAANTDDITRALGVAGFVGAVLLAKGAVLGLSAAIVANPIGALVTILTAGAAALALFGDKIKVSSDGITTLADVIDTLLGDGIDLLKQFVDNWTRGFSLIRNNTDTAVGDMKFTFKDFFLGVTNSLDHLIAMFLVVGRTLEEISWQTEKFQDAINPLNWFRSGGPQNPFKHFSIDSILGAMAEGADFSAFTDKMLEAFSSAETTARRRALAKFRGDTGDDDVEDAAIGPRPAATGLHGPIERANREKDILEDINAELRTKAGLLNMSASAREIEVGLMQIIGELAEKGRFLTGQEREELRARLLKNQALERQAALLERINGPQDALVLAIADLKVLYESGAISLQVYNDQLEEMERRLLALKNPLSDIEKIGVRAFDSLIDGITAFATGAEVNIERMVQSVIQQLLRLQIVEGLQTLFPNSALVGALRGSGQFGRPMQAGGDYLVGERGPEIVRPAQPSRVDPVVVPNQSITIVNVTDPNEISAVIDSGGADRAITNRVSRMRRSLNTVLKG